ncbi:MAG: hypothetical protein FJY16_01150 [Bacteroidetes bacterium]|nr:hypothetical protein [Bacteroidota bacterium]
MRKVFTILRGALLLVLIILTLLYITFQLPFVQDKVTGYVVAYLAETLQTKVKIKGLRFQFFNRFSIEDFYLEDRQGNPLIQVNKLHLEINGLPRWADSSVIENITARGLKIHLQRADSNWNHGFLLDFIKGLTSTNRKPGQPNMRLHLKMALLQEVEFLQTDNWEGQLIKAKLKKAELSARPFTVEDGSIEINKLALLNPAMEIRQFAGRNPVVSKQQSDSANTWRLDGKRLYISALEISGGRFQYDHAAGVAKRGFDQNHIAINGINATLSNSLMAGDTLQGQLKISATERCGFQLRSLTGNFFLSPRSLSLKQFNLLTNQSKLQDQLELSFKKLSDWEHFGDRVFIKAKLAQSIISTTDLSYFIPALHHERSSLRVAGELNGKLNDWNIKNLILQTSSNSYLEGALSVKGMMHKEFFAFSLQVKRSQILSHEVSNWLAPAQSSLNVALQQVKYLRFNGTVEGSSAFTQVNGVATTGLGSILSQLRFNYLPHAPIHYAGSVNLDQFEVGKLIGIPALASVEGTIQFNGIGLGEKNTKATAKALIGAATFNGYTLRHLSLLAELNQEQLELSSIVDDENFKTGQLVARINWENNTPSYQLTGQVEKANVKPLGITKLPIQFKGHIAAHLRGKSLADLQGSAVFRSLTVMHDEDLLPIDSLQILVTHNATNSRIEFNTNELQAWIDGRFNVEEFPSLAQTILHRHYPSFFQRPNYKSENNKFRFEINTQLVDPFLPLFALNLTGFNNSRLQGEYDHHTEQFNARINIPQFRYQKIGADNLSMQLGSLGDSLYVRANAGAIQLNENVQLPAVSFLIDGKNNAAAVSIRTAADKRGHRVNFNSIISNYKDGVEIDFTPSDFTINNKSWTISEGGTLVLRKDRPVNGYLKMAEGEQEITLKTLGKKSDDKDNLLVSIQNVNLNDFAPLILPDHRLEGLLSGDFLFIDPLNTLEVKADNISTKLLRLDNDSIGELDASLTYNNQLKELKATGKTKNTNEFIGFDLSLYFNDSLLLKNKIDLQTRSYPIHILERFLGDLFADITGSLTGNVSIVGDLNRPGVLGKGKLTQAGLRVNYTQCYYKIEDRELELTTSRIDLNGLVLRDTVTGNPIYLTGGIDHESFYNLFYDLDISTRKPGSRGANDNKPVQLLSTNAVDHSLFYGNIKGTALLQLRGPESDMVMTLNVTASDKDSSYFTLPPGVSRESGFADFLVERMYGEDMQGEGKKNNGNNILYDVELTANPLVEMKIILDELTGDEIKGNGAGTFKIRSGTMEPLTLRGRFDIDEGDYLFTLQSFFKKPFEIRKGGTNYIEWSGDPYDATIRFEAMYRAERVSFGPLASVLNLTADIGNARSDVYVVAGLSDKLFKPTISFYLDFPPNSVANTSPELGLLLKQLQQNSNELNRQVTYLIVFNSFAPNELGGALASTGVNVNTISGILLSVVSDQINKLFTTLLKSDKYRINLNTSLYNRNVLAATDNTLSLGSNVNFSIGRSFFNNRFNVSTGLGMDAPLGLSQTANLQQSILLLPDVTMEWLVNPSGTIRVSFFYRTNADFLSATTTSAAVRSRRAGGNLSYKKDFDRLSDLFRKKKRAIH